VLVILGVIAVSAGPAAATGPPVPAAKVQRSDATVAPAQRAHTAAAPAQATHQQPAVKRQATVGCVGKACQGKYAADEGCRDDRIQIGGFFTPEGNGWAAANFTLWHSPACRSAWAEYDSNGDAFSRVLRLQSIEEYGVPDTEYQVVIGGPGNYPTQMVAWDDSVRMCDSFGGPCTGWR
jgi:hypothetical protein